MISRAAYSSFGSPLEIILNGKNECVSETAIESERKRGWDDYRDKDRAKHRVGRRGKRWREKRGEDEKMGKGDGKKESKKERERKSELEQEKERKKEGKKEKSGGSN